MEAEKLIEALRGQLAVKERELEVRAISPRHYGDVWYPRTPRGVVCYVAGCPGGLGWAFCNVLCVIRLGRGRLLVLMRVWGRVGSICRP